MTPRILVTGGCGFIGSNLVHLLIEKHKAEVHNIDKLTYAANPLSLDDLKQHPNYRFSPVDICDPDALVSIVDAFKPTIVMHLAAESHVDRSIQSAVPFVQTNVVGTHHLLQTCYAYWKSLASEQQQNFRFLHVSTDEVFGSLSDEGCFTELTRYDPNSPYAATKAASDHLVRSYFRTYGFPILITNCSNNYGPRQFPEKLIPLLILQALAGQPLPVYGSGDNVRDWIYVDDHCDALWHVAQKGVPGETYLIGANEQRRNIDVVHAVCELLDQIQPGKAPYKNLIQFVTDRPGHDYRYAIDASYIKSALGWQAQYNFGAGIQKTVQWYVDNAKWVDNIRTGAYRQWLQTQYQQSHHKQ